MTKFIKTKGGLFLTALLQVTLVAMNIVFISGHFIIPMLVTGFLISLVWTLNVKKVAFGTWVDNITYAMGAMAGTGLGYVFSNYIIKYL